jgi:drug/metabolite transporter (DMT)-like permease
MKNPFIWATFYSILAALGQLLLKAGTNQIGKFSFSNFSEFLGLVVQGIKNPFILAGIILFVFGFFLWIVIISSFQLGVVFPLTAMVYIFVAWMSFFTLGETLGLINYFGMLLIALGIYFLLYR